MTMIVQIAAIAMIAFAGIFVGFGAWEASMNAPEDASSHFAVFELFSTSIDVTLYDLLSLQSKQ